MTFQITGKGGFAMKIRAILTICLVLGTAIGVLANGPDMARFFPDIPGMKKGNADVYTPDNLYEYIDGAADVFLAYDFVQLTSLTYTDEQKHSLIVDIYYHSTPNNGFGIYSQEKSRQGDFLQIGAQGYYEKGVLNFLRGCYYVKMSGFDLGDNDRAVMTATAKEIAGRLNGEERFPLPALRFPGKGKVKNSERYIANDFLGHSFLHSAFVADYEENGENFQLFIIEAVDATAVEKLVDNYHLFAQGKGSEVKRGNSGLTFIDPYYRANGPIHLKSAGKYLWGLFSANNTRTAYYMKELEDMIHSLHASL
jgi:hypothetical protein